jgi:hypothetical protein
LIGNLTLQVTKAGANNLTATVQANVTNTGLNAVQIVAGGTGFQVNQIVFQLVKKFKTIKSNLCPWFWKFT